MAERWEEIRVELCDLLGSTEKSCGEMWLAGLNEACKRIAALEPYEAAVDRMRERHGWKRDGREIDVCVRERIEMLMAKVAQARAEEREAIAKEARDFEDNWMFDDSGSVVRWLERIAKERRGQEGSNGS